MSLGMNNPRPDRCAVNSASDVESLRITDVGLSNEGIFETFGATNPVLT
jgi:hypothetical protein